MKPRTVVAMIGALVYACAGVIVLWRSLPRVVVAFREYWPERSGSGGLGAVSIGLSESLVEFVLPVAAIALNRKLARWARGSGDAASAVHRAHTWMIVAAFAIVIAGAVAFSARPGPLVFIALPLDAAMWGVLYVLTGALLGLYAAKSF